MVNREAFKGKSILIEKLADTADSDKQCTAVSDLQSDTHSGDEISSDKTADDRPTTRFPRVVLLACLGIVIVLVGATYVFAQQPRPEAEFVGPLPEAGRIVSEGSILPRPSAWCTAVDDIDGNVDAASYIVVTADSFFPIASKNADDRVQFASLVKLLSAMVIRENMDLDMQVGLREPVDDLGSGMDLEVGEMASVQELLGAVLVGSKNDAMYALSQNYPGGEGAMVHDMKEKAEDIGMRDTSIQNPIGLDSPTQYSTAWDLALLMVVAMRDPVLHDVLDDASVTVQLDSGRTEVVQTTNVLLNEFPEVIGGKTGFTGGAGQSLATYVSLKTDVVIVILNASDRYEETRNIIRILKDEMPCI